MGMAILIPSGILWKLMARARERPNFWLVDADKKVAIPSGILWRIIASIDTIPRWNNLLLLLGKNLSIKIENIIPVTKKTFKNRS